MCAKFKSLSVKFDIWRVRYTTLLKGQFCLEKDQPHPQTFPASSISAPISSPCQRAMSRFGWRVQFFLNRNKRRQCRQWTDTQVKPGFGKFIQTTEYISRLRESANHCLTVVVTLMLATPKVLQVRKTSFNCDSELFFITQTVLQTSC